jgi:hypothetical protein
MLITPQQLSDRTDRNSRAGDNPASSRRPYRHKVLEMDDATWSVRMMREITLAQLFNICQSSHRRK